MADATAPQQLEATTPRIPRRPDHRLIQAAVQEALRLAGYGELRQV